MKYGDMTIFKMAVVRYFEFSKFDIFGIQSWLGLLSRILRRRTTFCEILTIRCRVEATIWRLSAILKLKVLSFGSRILSESASAHKISSKSDEILLKYDEITIIEMAMVRQLKLSKFGKFYIRPFILSNFASLYKISWKTDNTITSYGQIENHRQTIAR